MSDTASFLETALTAEGDECVLWPFSLRNGYGQFRRKGQTYYAHAVICERAYGPRPTGMEAAHGPCHEPRCINPHHLSWKTTEQNQRDRQRDGTTMRNVGQKLTAADVAVIRERYLTGGWTQKQLAAEFGVSRTSVEGIVLGTRWAWL